MRGTELTKRQIDSARLFILARQRDGESPDDERTISLRFGDLVRLVAWYGAIRYKGALDGIGDEGHPGVAGVVEHV